MSIRRVPWAVATSVIIVVMLHQGAKHHCVAHHLVGSPARAVPITVSAVADVIVDGVTAVIHEDGLRNV